MFVFPLCVIYWLICDFSDNVHFDELKHNISSTIFPLMRTSCDNHCYDLLRFYIHCMLYVLLKYGVILKILFHFFFHPLIQFCNLWKCKADDFFSYHIYYIQRICAVCGINVVMFPACGSTGVRFIQILKLSHKNSFISI